MQARVATFEFGDASKLDQQIAEIRQQGADGPPENIPAKEFLMMIDRDAGRVVSVMLFDSEDDYRKGDETLNAMSPEEGSMRRTSVEKFEVPIHYNG
jgi:hypothetical protein